MDGHSVEVAVDMASSDGNLFRDRVRERDLDNFLVEELQASQPFLAWFLSRLDGKISWPPAAAVRLRKSPPRGDGRQTDVELGWFMDEALVACVLIESKVTADFQLGQAEAYAQETSRLRQVMGPDAVCCVLVAPRDRIASLNHSAHFDAAIALEDIAQTLIDRRVRGVEDPEIDGRLSVRIDLLEALAGKRARQGWTPVTVAEKRNFAEAYAALAKIVCPDLTVRPSTDGPKAVTRFFAGLPVDPSFPCRVALKHEFGRGVPVKHANLQFTGMAGQAAALRDARDLLEGEPYTIVAGPSALFVRHATPGLDPEGLGFEAQREKVVEGLRAIDGLFKWFVRHQAQLATILGRSPPKSASPSSLNPSAGGVTEDDLDRALRDLAEQSRLVFNYIPHYFLEMLQRSGALATAKTLLAGQVSDGFVALWKKGGLAVTVEALVVEEPWRSSGLFSVEEIGRAERRLRDSGYRRP